MSYTLTEADKQFFRANGYFILRGAIEKPLMDRVELQLWNAVDTARDDLSGWAERTDIRLDRPDERETGAMLEMSQHPNAYGICEQFVGTDVLSKPGGVDVLITCPRPGTEWNRPGHGHIDGFNIQHKYNAFTIGFTAYGLPVQHGGGAFTYWPGSHLKAWEHFQKTAYLDSDGRDSFSAKPGLGADLGPGEEFLGEPGDLLFWHNLLTHSGSQNVGTMPRFGLIARFTHHDIANIVEDREAGLWKYWEGMR